MEDTSMRTTRVLAIGNQKGGVNKTANAVNLAAALGTTGRRCLIIDLDGNCGATRALGIPDEWAGTFEVLLGLERAHDLILSTNPADGVKLPQNVDMLPASRKLEGIDLVFREMRENKFKDATDSLTGPIAQLQGDYDYILLDTAPHATSPTIAAYKVAEWFMLSMTPDKLAYEALVDALNDIVTVRQGPNPGLRLLGVILSSVDKRTRAASTYAERIQKNLQGSEFGAFETAISRAVAVSKATEHGLSIFDFDPEHKVTEQYRALAREIENRIASAESVDAESKAESSLTKSETVNLLETADA